MTDDQRWQAVIDRDHSYSGCFVYAVRTTGVYCRPGCASRLPLRKNVRFFATSMKAESAGFRACQRCQPSGEPLAAQQASAVAHACRIIESAETTPRLEELAAAVEISPYHFHRMFKGQTGITPNAYALQHRAQRVREQLTHSTTVTSAIYSAGYNSSGRFYTDATKTLGMKPTTLRAGGAGELITFAIGQCWLGAVLVAATERGICAIALDDEAETLARDLQDKFPRAEFIGDDTRFKQTVAQVVGFIESPARGLHLPLDIQGTAFQRRVWQALQQIPPGETVSYTELAARLSEPKAVRAVASACAANTLAVAIPCHRVVRTDGSLSGYRWGVDRKRALLLRESTNTT